MAWSSVVRVRHAALGVALLAVTNASCADVLGLDDPAGRLGEGGAGAATGTGTPAGSTSTDGVGPGTGGAGPGAGGGASTATSTATGASTSTSTGTGGGGGAGVASPGALALPAGFEMDALGTSDEGAVALVRWTGKVDGALCRETIPPGGVAAVAIQGSDCAVLTTLSGSGPVGIAIEQRGRWLGLAASGLAGSFTVNTPSPMSVVLDAGGAGVFGMWDVGTAGAGFLVGTTHPLLASRIAPRADGSAVVMQTTQRFGFSGGSGCTPAAEPTAGQQVHFTVLGPAPADCVKPRIEADGVLLDVAEADGPWGLIASAGNCHAFPADGKASVAFGSCSGSGHLLAVPDDGPDDVYLGATDAGRCGTQPGLVANLTGEADDLWCDGTGPTQWVIPFLADGTHVRFVRVTTVGSELWRVAVDGGATDEPVPLCPDCVIWEARVSNGLVYLYGVAGQSFDLFGEAITAGSDFWAWIPLADL